jgi:putative oxidoreductase
MFVDIGILLVRVLFGVAIAAHGAQKLFGWFGGYGLKGTGGFFETLGFNPVWCSPRWQGSTNFSAACC